jgi:hypothetical protein
MMSKDGIAAARSNSRRRPRSNAKCAATSPANHQTEKIPWLRTNRARHAKYTIAVWAVFRAMSLANDTAATVSTAVNGHV